jgi:hypothetical protein
MPIDRLSSTSALIAALRAEVSRKTERARGESTGKTVRGDASTRTRSHEVAALRRELVEIVKGVSSQDEAAMREVRPRIVRAVLLWEFGAELREYGEWQPMLDTLVRTLENDSRHRAAFVEMVRDLQS